MTAILQHAAPAPLITFPVRGNRLLAALGDGVLERIVVRTQLVRRGEILYSSTDVPEDLYFPHHGTIISLARENRDGARVEVGVVGPEGMTGINSLFASAEHGAAAIVQVAGKVSRVRGRNLREEIGRDPRARTLVLGYFSLFLDHLSQAVMCNSMHTIQQRLVKWLLIFRDRIGTDDLELSHEQIGHMLGCNRAGVTIAIGSLTERGLIEHSRKLISIRYPASLQREACECLPAILTSLNQFRESLRDKNRLD